MFLLPVTINLKKWLRFQIVNDLIRWEPKVNILKSDLLSISICGANKFTKT